jgi:putative inorganic carbon (HCO3(-)) transporter
MRDLLLIVAVLIGSIAAVPRPVFGVLLYTSFAYLNPNALAWTHGRSFPVAQFPAIATILGYLFWSESKKIPVHRETILLVGLWMVFSVSTIFSINRDEAFVAYGRITKVLLMTFLTTSLINNQARLKWFVRVIAMGIGLWASKGGLFVLVSGGHYHIWGPEDTWLEGNNAIGLVYTMNIGLLFGMLKLEKGLWMRRVIRVILLLSYPAVVCTYSRGAWLGLAGVTALMILKTKRKLLILVAVCLVTICLTPFLPRQLFERYETLENYQQDSSAESRFWEWEYAFRVALARPLTGGGFDVYSLETYARFLPGFLERFPGKVWGAHSSWFSILGEHGFVGLILWISLVVSCFLSCKKLHALSSVHSNLAWASHYAEMVQLALVAFVISGSFISASYFEIFYHVLIVVIVAKELVRGQGSVVFSGEDESFETSQWQLDPAANAPTKPKTVTVKQKLYPINPVPVTLNQDW